jgi:hypothetical protein
LPSTAAKLMSITSTTPDGFFSTSPSQKRRILNPREARNRLRCWSYARRSTCWPPSTSTTSLEARQQKSTMYRPIGNWRRNLAPSSDLRLSTPQSLHSASVIRRRKSRERLRVFAGVGFQRAFIARRIFPLPHLPPQLSGGRDRKGASAAALSGGRDRQRPGGAFFFALPPLFSAGPSCEQRAASTQRPSEKCRGKVGMGALESFRLVQSFRREPLHKRTSGPPSPRHESCTRRQDSRRSTFPRFSQRAFRASSALPARKGRAKSAGAGAISSCPRSVAGESAKGGPKRFPLVQRFTSGALAERRDRRRPDSAPAACAAGRRAPRARAIETIRSR